MRITSIIAIAFFVSMPLSGAEPWADAAWLPAGREATRGMEGDAYVSTSFNVGGGAIRVVLPAGRIPVGRDAVLDWTGSAATAMATYHGRFPVRSLLIRIETGGGGAIGSGVTYGGRLICIRLGDQCRPVDLERDWVMTHEMVHCSFPDLDDHHLWMEEGVATYLEPIVRARVGDIPAEAVWRDLVHGLPKGQPRAGDCGLDRTATWGRTYWGGAGYWLMADVRIREATGNRRSVDDVLRAVLAAGGDGTASWPLERVFDVAQEAIGVDTLRELHADLALAPKRLDLDALWTSLGVVPGRVLRFDDDAARATLRRAITGG